MTLIRNPDNRGFAHANNQALVRCRGDYLLLLNPDTVVHPRALSTLVAAMEAHPDAGIGGAKLLNSDGSLQYSCRRFPTFTAGLLRNNPIGRLFPGNARVQDYLMTEFDHAADAEVDWVSGAALCIRRATLEQIGLLDETSFHVLRRRGLVLSRRARPAGKSIISRNRSSPTTSAAPPTKQWPPWCAPTTAAWASFIANTTRPTTPPLMRWAPPLGIWVRMHLVLMEKKRGKRKK